MKNKILSFAILASLFLGCNWDYEKFKKLKKANLTFEKLKVDNKTIYSKQLLAQIQGKEKEGFIIKSIALSDATIAKVEGNPPNLKIKILKAGTFKITLLLEKKGFVDVKIEGKITNYIFFDFTYGDSVHDLAKSIIQTSDGNLVVAGETRSKGAGGDDIWILKLNKNNRKIIWEKTHGCNIHDYASSIIETADGNLVVAGYTRSNETGYRDIWILKLDNTGNKMWEKTYGGSRSDLANSIIETADGHLVVAGATYSNGVFRWDMWILKLNKNNGNIIWVKAYGGRDYDFANSIIETADGNLVVAGDSGILKIDKTNGSKIWENKNVRGNDIIETSDGHLVVAGGSIFKLDNTGNKIWEKTYGVSNSNNQASSIIQTSDGNLVVAGGTRSKVTDDDDIWILKLNKNNGKIIWEKTYGGIHRDNATSIIETADGNLVVAGYTYSKGTSKFDMWILKLYGNDGAIVGK